jgi:hypothetical protein
MNRLYALVAVTAFALTMFVDARAIGVEENSQASADRRGTLVFACDPRNDLYKSLVAGGVSPRRLDSAEEAIAAAAPKSAVLILANGYPEERTAIDPELLAEAKRKELQLYIEYPAAISGIEFAEPRGVRWERAVVASDEPSLGLPHLHLLAMHDCQFLPTEADRPLIVMARVAGFDTAVFGLPKESYPILFRSKDGTWIATTKLSDFVTARYAPSTDWLTLWQRLLAVLDPSGAPHKIVAAPLVRPAFDKEGALPANAEELALSRCADWYKNSRLLIAPEREAELHELMRTNQEVTPPPPPDAPVGDGSHGILEGYASQILPDGSQLQRAPIRADCQAETAAVFALHATLKDDPQSERIARNLTNYLYFDSELHQRERGDPKHPAYGLIAWGAISPAWRIANYGDDNARTLLATMAVAGSLKSDEWDEPMLKALYANLRTTGKLGFRGDRVDMPQLEENGWKAYEQGEPVNLSPSFEAYSWACFLWAYARTGDREFLDKTKIGIRRTMEAYPEGWRWGDNLDRSRMVLALAWLIRVEDTPEHRGWLKQVTDDLLKNQQPCGAIPEELSGATTGHFLAPTSNEAYGTGETPLLQEDGDPVTDQLYMTNFALIGLREAVAATNDPKLKAAEDKLAEYVVRIQVRSKAIPYLDGTWFRAFDFRQWDYWSSSGDMGWGAWCAETGWGPAWNGITLGLRAKQTSLWDLTKSSRIAERMDDVKEKMAQNDGAPWQGGTAK